MQMPKLFFGRYLVIKEFEPRLAKYEVQCRLTATEAWQVAYADTTAGTNFATTFRPVQARYVRLIILPPIILPLIVLPNLPHCAFPFPLLSWIDRVSARFPSRHPLVTACRLANH